MSFLRIMGVISTIRIIWGSKQGLLKTGTCMNIQNCEAGDEVSVHSSFYFSVGSRWGLWRGSVQVFENADGICFFAFSDIA